MARLTPAGLEAAALAAFPDKGSPKIKASAVRSYFALLVKNSQRAVAYGYLAGSNPLNQFTQTFTDSSLDKILYMENLTWGGKTDVGGVIQSRTFDGASEIVAQVADNEVQVIHKGEYTVDISLHGESGGNNRQLVLDLVRVSSDGLTETPYLFDLHVNGYPGRTNSVSFPSVKIGLLAGERLHLAAKMSTGEPDTEFTFIKCLMNVELYELTD